MRRLRSPRSLWRKFPPTKRSLWQGFEQVYRSQSCCEGFYWLPVWTRRSQTMFSIAKPQFLEAFLKIRRQLTTRFNSGRKKTPQLPWTLTNPPVGGAVETTTKFWKRDLQTSLNVQRKRNLRWSSQKVKSSKTSLTETSSSECIKRWKTFSRRRTRSRHVDQQNTRALFAQWLLHEICSAVAFLKKREK